MVDDIEPVSSQEAQEMARRLAREEGLFAGTSTGANVVAALRVADRLGPSAIVATIAVDSGLRYLSTEPYR
jgi:cysteine synthase A